MKVAFVTINSLSIFGGLEKVALRILNQLIDTYKCDISIISLVPTSASLNSLVIKEFNGFPVCRATDYRNVLQYRFHILRRKLLGKRMLINRFSLARCLTRFPPPDVFLVTWPTFLTTVVDFVEKHSLNSSVVYWDHGALSYFLNIKGFRGKIRRTAYYKEISDGIKASDAHLAISSGIAEIIKKIHPEAKVYLVYNPVPRYDGPLIQRPRKPTFLYVGRISDREKNISFMLKGLSRLRHKDWQLKIVGTGPDEKKLKKLAGKLGIADRISWLGFKKDPYSEFQEITALLLTSRYEGFGMVLVEANQRGIPVISSDCESGPKDIVIAGVNGYLYREGDMGEFVRIIGDVIDGRLSFDTPENIAKTAERFREDVVVENIYTVA